jgi:ectoine hydroxylase-related dioxygenase (phytanoyl-CoA dioxygenase family)
MKLNEGQISDYKKNGFIVLRNFFDKQKIAATFRDVKEVFAIQFSAFLEVSMEQSMNAGEDEFATLMSDLYHKDFTIFSNCSKQVQNLVSLHELGVSRQVVEILNELGLAKPILSVRPCVLMNNKGLDKGGETGKYWRLPPHQDWYYSQGSVDSVTVWYPYVPVDKKLGSLELIPGSHLWGLQKCGDDNDYGEMTEDFPDNKYVTFDTNPGDVLVFVSLTVHRSGINSTNRVRWSSQFRFNNLVESTFVERRFPNPFVYHPTRLLETPGFPKVDDLKKTFG